MEPKVIAEALADHRHSIFNSSYATQVHSNPMEMTSSDFVKVPLIFDSDVKQAFHRLKSTKCVGLDDIPSFIIKGCSEIFVPVLKHIFNLSLSNGIFLSLWKDEAAVPIFKKGSSALVTNYIPISLLNNPSKVFEIIIHDHFSYYLISKLQPSQHGFITPKSTVTNLNLNTVTPVFCSQGQMGRHLL
jgi:hypothetical protein